MGRPKGWITAATGRPAMRSPGRPPVANREASAAVLGTDRRGADQRGCGGRERRVTGGWDALVP